MACPQLASSADITTLLVMALEVRIKKSRTRRDFFLDDQRTKLPDFKGRPSRGQFARRLYIKRVFCQPFKLLLC